MTTTDDIRIAALLGVKLNTRERLAKMYLAQLDRTTVAEASMRQLEGDVIRLRSVAPRDVSLLQRAKQLTLESGVSHRVKNNTLECYKDYQWVAV